MRRSRRRRGRTAALASLAFAAMIPTTTTSLGATPSAASKAQIDASAQSVVFGDRVTLSGSFPGAHRAPLEIRHRAQGASEWKLVRRGRTGASGRYSVRVEPRRSGYWRAALGQASAPQGAPPGLPGGAASPKVDPATGAEPIAVRSRTVARVAGRHALVGDTVTVRGRVMPVGAERRVVVRVGDSKLATRAGRDGRFDVAWRAPSTGSHPVRVIARPNRVAGASRETAGRVIVYRQASASWYGPGLYGNRTACGQTLTSAIVGVAHKTMPCGTRLELRYGGRTVTARVIDRGPFVGDREFDLTSATRQRLGFPDTGTVLSSR